jgi:hypothetical protein
VNYDEAGVRSLAEQARDGTQESAPTAGTGSLAADQVRSESPGAAKACLLESGAPLRDPDYQLVRLIEAEFEGTPAYLAVFLQGPGAGQPPDHAVVWVTSKDDCGRILHTASLPL